MCGWALSWRMCGPATSNWNRFLCTSSEGFAPVTLEISSHVARRSSSKASATSFTFVHLLMFSPSCSWIIVYTTGAQKWHIVSLHCDVTTPTTVAHYVSMTCSEHREALTAAPTAGGVHIQAIRVQGWSRPTWCATEQVGRLRYVTAVDGGQKHFTWVAWFAHPWSTLTQPTEKRLTQPEIVQRSNVVSQQTSVKALWISVGFFSA